jgi:8-amino-7-oxononanoate synthase
MPDGKNALFGLDPKAAARLLAPPDTRAAARPRSVTAAVPERFTRIVELPQYRQLQVQRLVAEKMDIKNLFFTCHESRAQARTRIGGRDFLNFATYDYLALNGHPEVNAAATEAVNVFGTSAGASRLVAGERPQHAALEQALAALYGTDNALAFVSGHATNMSVLSALFGSRDAVYHDALSHNSLVLGARLSGAVRHAWPHNDCAALADMLRRTRHEHERAVIVTEGLFSMDGSIARLPELLELKREYGCFLMVDEAHALGTLGATGRGVAEHYGLNAADMADVDIWMGTLSKTLCACGGFIAGSAALVELLKYTAPGFVYSVGMSPPLAAAAARALEIMLREPERVAALQRIAAFFLREARARGLDTGRAEGGAVVPVMVGNSLIAGQLAAMLFERGINALPIVYPVVEEGMARLRFFLSSAHTENDITCALDAVAADLPAATRKVT